MVRACVCLQKYQSLVVVVVVGALRKVAPTPKEYQAIRVVRKENILTHTRFLPDVHTPPRDCCAANAHAIIK
jgi:hypothetical protein